jgi:hypothetical protein
VQHCGRAPAAARLAQLVVGLVVTGHEHGRLLDHHEHVDQLRDSAVQRAEVARRHDHVGLGRARRQRSRLVEVAVDVAEREQPHGAPS